MEPKKNPRLDLSKKSGLFLNIGLCASLFLIILAFEWRSYDTSNLVDLGSIEDFDEIIQIPVTEIPPPPPPPKIKPQEILEVPDEEEIEEIVAEIDQEAREETVIEAIIFETHEEEEVDEIFTFVEESATPAGGFSEFYKYLGKNIKYPRPAQRMGIEGKVFVKFVVEKDGSLTDIQIMKGIGAGCDEEAKRVLQNSPKWNPGRQRGNEVRQAMVIPIVFNFTN